MRTCFIIIFILTINISKAQIINNYYIAIPSDSISDCKLRFVNDSIVELSNVPRHMAGALNILFKYTAKKDTIEILTSKISSNDSSLLNSFRLEYFIRPKLILIAIDKYLIDYSNSIIYILQKDYKISPDLAYMIDGKIYYQDMGVTNSYGLLEKSPKNNRKLQNRMKLIGQNPDNYSFEVLKGLEAYKRYGLKLVYGVIVISTKQK